MRKWLSFMLAIILVMTMAACQSDDPAPTDNPNAIGYTTEPTDDPTAEPTTEPTEEPTTEPTAAPITEPATDPSTEPTDEPATEPAVDPTTESTEEPTIKPQGTTYILNTNSKKFHYPSCSSVETMNESNKDTFTGSREELIAMGYDPCGRCDP